MRKYLILLAAAGLMAAPKAAHAYVATTGLDSVTNGDNDNSGNATLGDTFDVTSGTFTGYVADQPGDPALSGGDLASYRYTLHGIVASVTGNDVDYTGTYGINYQGFGSVSAGTFNINAIYAGNTAALTGTLSETSHAGAPFADLGPSSTYAGTYTGNVLNPLTGTLAGAITRGPIGSAVPEPGTFALLGTGLLPLLGLRRRK